MCLITLCTKDICPHAVMSLSQQCLHSLDIRLSMCPNLNFYLLHVPTALGIQLFLLCKQMLSGKDKVVFRPSVATTHCTVKTCC